MTDAHARGWGDPSAKNYRAEHIVAVNIAPLPTLYLRREVAHLFMGFLQEIIARGYKLNNVKDDWAYAYRPIRGYEAQWQKTRDFHYLSNHSWGLALDLDSTDHPLGTHKNYPRWVVDVARKWGLSWGGDYVNRPDPMHFEVLGTPADVAKYPLRDEEEDMATWKDWSDAEKMTMVDLVASEIVKRLSDTSKIPGDRMNRAVNASERIAKHFQIPLA